MKLILTRVWGVMGRKPKNEIEEGISVANSRIDQNISANELCNEVYASCTELPGFREEYSDIVMQISDITAKRKLNQITQGDSIKAFRELRRSTSKDTLVDIWKDTVDRHARDILDERGLSEVSNQNGR